MTRRRALLRLVTIAGLLLGMVGLAVPAHATPPVPTITLPAEGSLELAAVVHVAGEGSPEAFVHLYENGSPIGGVIVPDEAGDWSIDIPFADGSHTITARSFSIEEGEGEDSAPRTFVVDAPPAKPAWTKPAANAQLASANVLLEGTAETGTTVTLTEGERTIAADLPVTSAKWSTTAAFTEGPHTVSAVATDARGRSTDPAERAFTVDLTAPGSPSITEPAADALFGSTSVRVSGTAEAGSTVRVFEGTTSKGTATANASGAWSQTITFGNGAHTVTARATDAAGNQGPSSAPRSFTVDTVAPTVTITTPNDTVFTQLAPATITGTASDGPTGSGVARIELRYEWVTGAFVAGGNATCDCGGRDVAWSGQVPSNIGYFRVEAIAVDAAGNRSAPAEITFVRL